jgi:hypothetical protein
MIQASSSRPLISSRHALGHADIDFDHFAIADAWMEARLSESIALPMRVARLRRLMRAHFEHEAALVEATGSRFCQCHRREHDAMLAMCDEALSLAERRPRSARSVLRALPPLFRSHIDCMDQIAVLIIHSAAGSLPSRDARTT